MSISKRLFLLMATAVVALTLVAGFGYLQMKKVYDAANEGNINVVPSLLILGDARKTFLLLRLRAYRTVTASDPQKRDEAIKSLEEARTGIQNDLKAYEPLISDAEDRRLLDEVKKGFADYGQTLAPIIELARQGRSDEALKSLEGVTAQARGLQKSLDEHMQYNKKLSDKSTADAAATMTSATWTAAIASLVAIVAVGILGLQIRSGLMARLNEANRMAAGIASGDLSTRNTPSQIGNDEAGQLIQAMEKMRQDLAGVVGQIAASSDRLAHSASELSTTAQQVSSSTQNQSSSTAASAAALEQLTVSIDHVGESAVDASQRADEAGSLAIESGKGVDTAAAQIHQVADSIDQTARQIQLLSEHVHQIGNITTVIRDVADQTNLLALNAAIEAARAGEQGRGFAVVADEVRKLAERTTLSVQEISSVISTIQNSVATTVDSMQSNCQLVAGVVTSAQQASGSMHGIREATETVRDAIAGISEAMREQRSASTELSRNVEGIAQMSEENTAAVASVASTANTLVGVSGELKSAVARFRL
ncbi:methyl-accepting chemotaxis protein [uncultured Dechloromonas sp.]|uniref:methyl-accepting chemotaxis protein n=1 Tax=uncultured Dechloromonas sp. TaxID=171719 RepID=UPI0025F7438E|nr:methyl-accepting chemotaxis protein [uncultured Dechloromonas sp.]